MRPEASAALGLSPAALGLSIAAPNTPLPFFFPFFLFAPFFFYFFLFSRLHATGPTFANSSKFVIEAVKVCNEIL